MIKLLLLIISYFFTGTQGQKLLVLNDIHYSPNLTESLHCHWGNCTDMGLKGSGFDSPLSLINFVLDKAVETLENIDGTKKPIDGVIITGDFVRHHYYFFATNNSLGKPSSKHNKLSGGLTEAQKFEKIKEIWNVTYDAIETRFKNVPILPTFGNNDWLRNYATPNSSDTSEFNYQGINQTDKTHPNFFVPYDYLYDLWLEKNEKHLTTEQKLNITYTFTGSPSDPLKKWNSSNSGWYEYPLNKELSVMCINSIFFSDRGVSGLIAAGQKPLESTLPGQTQLNWIKAVLSENAKNGSPKKYIFMMHIPPGLNYFIQEPGVSPVQMFWVPSFQDQYIKTVNQFQDDIIIGLGAHIHRADIKAQVSSIATNLTYVTFLSPSISPIYDNNPSFSLLEIEPKSRTIYRLMSWSFDLTSYTFFRSNRWTKFDWIEDFDLDFSSTNNAVKRIRTLYQDMMNDSYLFSKYVAACYGMNWIETRMYQFGHLKYLLDSPLIQLGPNCVNTYMEATHPLLKTCWGNNVQGNEFMLPSTVN